MQTSKHPAVPLAMTAVMAAVLSVVSPFSISIGPIPLSLCTLVIYMNAYILGWKRALWPPWSMSCWARWVCPCSTASPPGWAWWPVPPAAISWAMCPWPSSAGWRCPLPPKNRVVQFIGMILGHRGAVYPGHGLVLLPVRQPPGGGHGLLRDPLPPRRLHQNGGGRRCGSHDPHQPGEGRAVSPGLSIPQTFLTR